MTFETQIAPGKMKLDQGAGLDFDSHLLVSVLKLFMSGTAIMRAVLV
jgi:hypothetical protein